MVLFEGETVEGALLQPREVVVVGVEAALEWSGEEELIGWVCLYFWVGWVGQALKEWTE